MEPSSSKHGAERQEDDRHLLRMIGTHGRRSRSPISGLKPFLLVGLLVVIGLLVGLGALLRQPDGVSDDLVAERVGGASRSDNLPTEELVPGAMTIGRPPDATTPMGKDRASRSTGTANPAGQPVTPSEFTFYETLKKAPQDPAATVGLTNPKVAAPPAPSSNTAPPPAQAPKPAVKPQSRVIETATVQNDALRYTVQVGAFREQPVAERLIADLNRKGHTAYLMTAPVEDGMTYRVRVGKFATKEEADRVAKRLATQEGLHPFVATIQPNS